MESKIISFYHQECDQETGELEAKCEANNSPPPHPKPGIANVTHYIIDFCVKVSQISTSVVVGGGGGPYALCLELNCPPVKHRSLIPAVCQSCFSEISSCQHFLFLMMTFFPQH